MPGTTLTDYGSPTRDEAREMVEKASFFRSEPGGRLSMESDALKVVIDPAGGGKIGSFVSRQTQRDFFYQDPRQTFPGDGYSDHDISGFDECFPTVWPCKYPDGQRRGMSLADHGYLWQGPWEVQAADDRLVMRKDVPELQCRFERTCFLDTTRSLKLDYLIENNGEETLKYVYSAHPMLAADEHTQLILPEEINRMFVSVALNVPGLVDKTWIDWPLAGKAGLDEPFSSQKCSVVKLCSDRLKEGRAVIYHRDLREGLQFEFDTENLPHLGVLIQQGYSPDETAASNRQLFLGLEPTTGMGDDLPSCESTGTVREIQPGQEVRFGIRLKLLSRMPGDR